MSIMINTAKIFLVVLLWPLLLLGPLVTAILLVISSLVGCGVAPRPQPPKPTIMYLTNLEDEQQVHDIIQSFRFTSRMHVVIDSTGGWTHLAEEFGTAAKVFMDRGGTLKCTVDGVAYSAAFTVWTHCGERAATRRSQLLWHEPAILNESGGRVTARYLERVGPKHPYYRYLPFLRQQTNELLRHFEQALPMDSGLVVKSYQNDWNWRATSLHAEVPTFFELID